MHEQFSIAEAKNKLPAIIHNVENGPPIQLTRRGKPVAMIISVEEYERLAGKCTDFWTALVAFRKSLEKEGVEFSGEEFEGLRDKSIGREMEL